MKTGITGKLLGWYFIFVLIFFCTVLVLYINVQEMMKISENIVNKNDKITFTARKMFESLLNMEENEKKFVVLKKDEYADYFNVANQEFEMGLREILTIESKGMTISNKWKELNDRYRQYHLTPEALKLKQIELSEELWIPESELDDWRRIVSEARTENEQEVEQANRELNRRGLLTVQSGLAGLGISVLIGLLGGVFLAHSMIGPLRELIQKIRTISYDRPIEPIEISSRDEFGELAAAFNEMAFRLKEEQRMRSDFISMLSHEIRTPLTSIRESVNLISEGVMGEINERQQKFLEIAHLEIGRVCDLLNRIMQVSYLESGALEIQPSPIPCDVLIAECIRNIQPAMEAKRISIEIQISPHAHAVNGDLKYLQQVFSNLLGNAIKYSPSDSKLSVKVEPDGDPTKLRFFVSDTGPGIPENEHAFIFNRYYRAKGVRESTDGAGLGLSIAKHIIEAHGGAIRVISKCGEGTTFTFTLPTASEKEICNP